MKSQKETPELELPDGMLVLPNDHVPMERAAPVIFKCLAKSKRLFTRGGAVVELLSGRLETVEPDGFRSRITRYGKPTWAYKLHNYVPILSPKQCPRDTATLLIKSVEARELLPSIKLVVRYPVLMLVDGGAKTLGKGYHPENDGIIVERGLTISKVNHEKAAVDIIKLLADFDFSSAGDKARALAMMITPALSTGGFIGGPIPADVAEADESQAGKTFRQKMTRWIYGETPYQVTMTEGGVGSIDEAISEAYISGKRFCSIDNMRGRLASQVLESGITADGDPIHVRAPHKGRQEVIPDGVNWQMTSNGVDTTQDFANRASIIRIVKHQEEHQWHAWVEGSLEQHIKSNHGHYLGCVYSLIAHWVDKGMPRETGSHHDFHAWAGIVNWFSLNVFNAGDVMEGHRDKQSQVSNPHFKWLRDFCIEVSKSDQLGVEMKAGEIADFCEHEAISWPGGRVPMDSRMGAAIGMIMKVVFRGKNEFIELDRFIITRREEDIYDQFRSQYMLTKFYKVTVGKT